MSHFTTIKTEIRDRAILLKALQGLKVRFQENGTLQGHQNQKQTVDLVIQGDKGFTWGFRKTGKDGAFQVTGVLEDLRNSQLIKMVDAIQQEYARLKVLAEARKEGFGLILQQRTETGAVKLILRKVGKYS